MIVGGVVQAHLDPQFLDVQAPAFAVGMGIEVLPEPGRVLDLVRQRALQVMARHTFVQRQRDELVQGARLQRVGVDPVLAAPWSPRWCRDVTAGRVVRGNLRRDRFDGVGLPWQLAEIRGQAAIGLLCDPGGAHEQFLGRPGIELRVGTQELEEFIKTAIEPGLRNNVIHLFADARDLAQAAFVDVVRRRGIQRRVIAHQRGVIRLTVRQFTRAERGPRVRHVALVHEVANPGICRYHLFFEQVPGFGPQTLLVFSRYRVRYVEKRCVQRMRVGRLGHLRVEGHEDVVHDLAGLRESGLDTELHVDTVLFEVTGQRIEPGKIVAVIVHAVESGRRDYVADIHVETGIRKKGYAPGREFAE